MAVARSIFCRKKSIVHCNYVDCIHGNSLLIPALYLHQWEINNAGEYPDVSAFCLKMVYTLKASIEKHTL